MTINHLKMYQGCLIVVDMVNESIKEGDKNKSKVIPRQIELIRDFEDQGKLVVYVRTTRSSQDTKDTLLVDELKDFENSPNAISVEKNSTSFMESPAFRELMDSWKSMVEFDIVGCNTDRCIATGAIGLANYLDERNRDHIIRVHEDAITTSDSLDTSKPLMKQQGIQFVKKR